MMTFDRQGGEVWVRSADRSRSREPLIGAERPKPRVVADQHVRPTAVPDLADPIASVLARIRTTDWQPAHRGVFHAVAAGFTTCHGFAEAIFAAAPRPRPRVQPTATADCPTRARRPADGRLDTGKLARVFGVAMPPWEEVLARVIRALHAA